MSGFYQVMWSIFTPLFRVLHPTQVEGLENIPADEAVVICANHSHALDPVLLGLSMPRSTKVRFMAKKQLFQLPLIGKLLAELGAFPVDRGNSDIGAVKKSIRSLRDGFHLLIFPEGTRVKTPGEVRAKGGAAMIAARSGVKMLPVFIGTEKKLFHKVKIAFGQPYAPVYTGRHGTMEEYQAAVDEIMRQIYELGDIM